LEGSRDSGGETPPTDLHPNHSTTTKILDQRILTLQGFRHTLTGYSPVWDGPNGHSAVRGGFKRIILKKMFLNKAVVLQNGRSCERRKAVIKAVSSAIGFASFLWLVSTFSAIEAQGTPEGRSLVQERCAMCHNLTRVRRHIVKNDAKAWDAYVARMQKNGARVTDAEREVIVAFLSSLESGEDL